jgi:hypothetical protein
MSKLLLSHRYFNRSLKVCSAFPSRKLAADGDIPQAMHPAFLNSKSPKQSAHFKCVRFFGKDCQLRMGQLNIFYSRDFAAVAPASASSNVIAGEPVEKPCQ